MTRQNLVRTGSRLAVSIALAAIALLAAVRPTFAAEQIRAATPSWSDTCNVPGDYESAQAVCDARRTYINWGTPLDFVPNADDPDAGRCQYGTHQPWETLSFPYHGLYCPDGYSDVNKVSWVNCGGGRHHFRGPNAYCVHVGIDPQKNAGSSCPSCGNPINPGTSNKYQLETDYVAPGGLPLRFERIFNSRGVDDYGVVTAQNVTGNPQATVGVKWRHTYQRSVSLVGSVAATTASVDRPDGKQYFFTLLSGGWAPDSDVVDRLERQLDSGGNAIGWKYTTADDAVELYDIDGRLLSLTTRTGIAQTMIYSDGSTPSTVAPWPNLLIGVVDSFGHALAFIYNAKGFIVSMSDPAGQVYRYTYDSKNNMTSVALPDATPANDSDNPSRIYHYELASPPLVLPNFLTGITDESAVRFSTYTYDSQSRATVSQYANGIGRVSVSYFGIVAQKVTDALNRERNYSFSTVLGVSKNTSIDAPCGDRPCDKSKTYDANGNAAARVDFNNFKTCYNYDLARNLETARLEGLPSASACPANIATYTPVVGTRQRKILTQWHATFRQPTLITEFNRTTALTHDTNGNVLSRTVTDTTTAASRTWNYTYSSFGQVLAEDGPRTDVTDVTTYTYYSCTTGYQCGQVHTIADALGHITTYGTYNGFGQPLTVTDPNGVVTTLTYDARQRLTSRTVGNEQTTLTYWPTGLLKRVTLPDTSYLEYSYDAAHRLTGIVDADGNSMTYTLDLMGNRTAEQVRDPSSNLAQMRTRVFDALNRLQKDIGAADTAAVTTQYGYDDNGNLKTINAPLGRNTGQSFDELNRLSAVTDPGTGITQYGYNPLDQLVTVTDPRGKATSYTYNALGDQTQLVSPDTGTAVSTHDSAGNLATRTDARNKTGTYSYDALNRVTQLSYPDQTIAYTYDVGANAIGRLSSVTDASGSSAWTYDAQGRVTSHQQTVGTVSKATSNSYNGTSGQRQSMTLPSGNVVSYGYQNGRIASLTLNGSTAILSNVLYQPFGPTLGWTWGNSTLAVREYDTDGKVTDIDSAGLKTYAYDDAFRVAGISDASNPSLSQSYGYDLLDRLTSAIGPGLNQSWTYDANGNRLTQGGGKNSTFTVSSTSNRLSSVSGSLVRTYGYDAAGNTTSDGTATYAYDDSGRMVSVTKAGVTATYSINALGQRVKKAVSGVSTYFVYDEAGHLVGEYDGSGVLIQETIWFGDIPVAVLKPNGSGGVNLFYIHTDHLNTPRRISRPSDNVIVWRWESGPFGVTPANQDQDGDGVMFSYNLRFPGQYYDAESGLHYNYFRDYDPATGRYVQSDLIGLEGGINTYGYVRGSPTMIIDPAGLGFSDYLTCIYQEAKYGGSASCRNEFFATAEAEAWREFQGRCDAIGEFVSCVATCAFSNFIAASYTDAIVNAHKQVFINRLNRIAKETANRHARRFIPIIGQVDTFSDATGTISCTTDCVKK